MTEEKIKKINEIFFDEETEKTLQKLEKTKTEFWNLDRPCAMFLNSLIKIKNAKNVLEIGTSNGYSGMWILGALRHTKGKLTTIEFWEKRQSIARNNFKNHFSDVVVEPKIGSAIVVLEDLLEEIQTSKREKFDFIFIDANKKEYIQYFELIDKMITDNGVILADNILSHYKKVQDYTENLFNRYDYQSQILDFGAGMMLSIKV